MPPTEPTAPPDTAAWPAVPSPPASDAGFGTLLLMHVSWSDMGINLQNLIILADGQVIRREAGLEKRRLTAAGVDFVRAELAAVGLFDQDRRRPLLKPLDCCGAGDQLRVRLGDATVRVERLLAFRDSYAPSVAWNRFDALVAKLADPDAWLPADTWADPGWSPYHAPQFCLSLSSSSPGGAALSAAGLGWPAGVRPFASFGKEGWSSDTRVGIIQAADAYSLASSIVVAANAAGIPNDHWYERPLEQGGSFTFPAVHDGQMPWLLALEPLPPDWQECSPVG